MQLIILLQFISKRREQREVSIIAGSLQSTASWRIVATKLCEKDFAEKVEITKKRNLEYLNNLLSLKKQSEM